MVIYTLNEQNSFHVTCCLTLFQYEIHSRMTEFDDVLSSNNDKLVSLVLVVAEYHWSFNSLLWGCIFLVGKEILHDAENAENGCTKRTFFNTEDQLGRFASFLDHHCSFSSSVCKSAPSATAKYLGSSAVSPCMMASLSRKRNLLNSSTEAAVGRSCWTCTRQHNLALRKARTFS